MWRQGGINWEVGLQSNFHLFRLTARKRHFGGKRYRILMFRTKTASIFLFIGMHAKISNAPLQSALNLALPLAPSRTFWLSLTQSGSLWFSLWPSQALIGSQGLCSALHVVDAWPQFIPACVAGQIFRSETMH